MRPAPVPLGEVQRTAQSFSYAAEIRDGKEPYFGLELWFLSSFQGKPVWAVNRKEGPVFRLLLLREGVQPIAKSISVILPIAHAPADGVSLNLPESQPEGRQGQAGLGRQPGTFGLPD